MFASRGSGQGPMQDLMLAQAMGMLDESFLPPAGKVTFLEGDEGPVDMLAHSLCSRAAASGSPVYWVDGGNIFDPHRLSRMMRRQGSNPRMLLERVHVSRAFTAHQMCAIVEEGLEAALREHGPGLVLLPRMSSPYLDEDVDRTEAQHLLRGSLHSLQELSRRHQVPMAVSAQGGRGRERMQRSVKGGSDDSMRVSAHAGVLRVQAPGGKEALLPLAPGQTSFRSFQEA